MFGDRRFDWKQPYRCWTNLRMFLPRPFGWLLNKGKDCGIVGATHEWYNVDNVCSGCYHCGQVRSGRLWESVPETVTKEKEDIGDCNH